MADLPVRVHRVSCRLSDLSAACPEAVLGLGRAGSNGLHDVVRAIEDAEVVPDNVASLAGRHR